MAACCQRYQGCACLMSVPLYSRCLYSRHRPRLWTLQQTEQTDIVSIAVIIICQLYMIIITVSCSHATNLSNRSKTRSHWLESLSCGASSSPASKTLLTAKYDYEKKNFDEVKSKVCQGLVISDCLQRRLRSVAIFIGGIPSSLQIIGGQTENGIR